ncbi:MAG: hypothetical protein WAK95_18205 [Desulfobacterales bacterium]
MKTGGSWPCFSQFNSKWFRKVLFRTISGKGKTTMALAGPLPGCSGGLFSNSNGIVTPASTTKSAASNLAQEDTLGPESAWVDTVSTKTAAAQLKAKTIMHRKIIPNNNLLH